MPCSQHYNKELNRCNTSYKIGKYSENKCIKTSITWSRVSHSKSQWLMEVTFSGCYIFPQIWAVCTHKPVYRRLRRLLALALKWPVIELLQKLPPDSQKTYTKWINALELWYEHQRLHDVQCTMLNWEQSDNIQGRKVSRSSFWKHRPSDYKWHNIRCFVYTIWFEAVNPMSIYMSEVTSS